MIMDNSAIRRSAARITRKHFGLLALAYLIPSAIDAGVTLLFAALHRLLTGAPMVLDPISCLIVRSGLLDTKQLSLASRIMLRAQTGSTTVLLLAIIMLVVEALVVLWLSMGTLRLLARLIRDDHASLRTLFSCLRSLPRMVVGFVWTALCTLVWCIPGLLLHSGLLLCILPLVALFHLQFVPPILALQPEVSPLQAPFRSRNMLRGRKWALLKLDLSYVLRFALISAACAGIVHLSSLLLGSEYQNQLYPVVAFITVAAVTYCTLTMQMANVLFFQSSQDDPLPQHITDALQQPVSPLPLSSLLADKQQQDALALARPAEDAPAPQETPPASEPPLD